MRSSPSPDVGALVGGALLILGGVALLVVQAGGVTLDWPVWIVTSGVATIGEGGAAAWRFRVPPGVAVRARTRMAIGTTDVDEARFPRDPLGGWASPDVASNPNRVELDTSGGMGSISIR
jgi:hypothetical protein